MIVNSEQLSQDFNIVQISRKPKDIKLEKEGEEGKVALIPTASPSFLEVRSY